MAAYVVRDTFFDNVRAKKGPVLPTHNIASRSRISVPNDDASSKSQKAEVAIEGPDEFQVVRYDDVVCGVAPREKGDS